MTYEHVQATVSLHSSSSPDEQVFQRSRGVPVSAEHQSRRSWDQPNSCWHSHNLRQWLGACLKVMYNYKAQESDRLWYVNVQMQPLYCMCACISKTLRTMPDYRCSSAHIWLFICEIQKTHNHQVKIPNAHTKISLQLWLQTNQSENNTDLLNVG